MDAELWHAHARSSFERPDPMTQPELDMISWHAMSARKRDICAWVSNLHLETPESVDVTAAMSSVVARNRMSPPGAKTIVAVTAPNTAGKSTLVRRWAISQYRSTLSTEQLSTESVPAWWPSRELEADLVPVVWMNLQAGAGRKEFNAQLLNFLGHRSDGVLRATNEKVAVTIARQGVRLVIVDDIHLLRTHHRDGQTVLDHLKYINTALGEHHATLVLVGANIRGGDIAADPQIAGRMRLLDLVTFPIDTADQKLRWQRLLKHAEEQLLPFLPRSEPGFLSNRAGLIWRRCQGYLGDLGTLLRQATYDAVDSDTWDIGPESLASIPLSERAGQDEAHLTAQATKQRKAS